MSSVAENVRRSMRANGPKWSAPEVRLVDALIASGLEVWWDDRLRGRPDALVRWGKAGPAIAVFMHGCFWHGCPEHCVAPRTNVGYWLPKILANRRRDARVAARLRREGLRVAVVWEHDAVDGYGLAKRVTAIHDMATGRR